MALSTTEPGLPYRVTEREREADSELGKQEKEMMIEGQRERETSFKRVSAVPQGGHSDAISLSSPSLSSLSLVFSSLMHMRTTFCHICRQIVMHSAVQLSASSSFCAVTHCVN